MRRRREPEVEEEVEENKMRWEFIKENKKVRKKEREQ